MKKFDVLKTISILLKLDYYVPCSLSLLKIYSNIYAIKLDVLLPNLLFKITSFLLITDFMRDNQ